MELDLFRYEDEDGDELTLRPSHNPAGSLMFHCDRDEVRHSVRVPRDVVERLHNALGAWLYPNEPGPKAPLPVRPVVSLTPADVRSIVAEQMAVVLPLHLAHLGTAQGNDPIPARKFTPCNLSQPIFKLDDAPCSECGNRWGDHPGVIAARSNWLAYGSTPADCDTPPPAGHPFTAIHDACGYLWVTHKRASDREARPCPECTSASCRGVDCAWEGDLTAKEAGHPDAPEGGLLPDCTHPRCGHKYGDHGLRGGLFATCLRPECGCTRYRSTR